MKFLVRVTLAVISAGGHFELTHAELFGPGGSKVKVREGISVTIMMDPISNAHGGDLGVHVIWPKFVS